MTFLAVAKPERTTFEKTAARAPVLMPSGRILWGFDPEFEIWDLYGTRRQPVSVLITNRGEIIDFWYGILGEEETRARIERLVEASA
ncbi:MAG: TlpA family protein disulfide reductase [Acidimicrobiia bacterium]